MQPFRSIITPLFMLFAISVFMPANAAAADPDAAIRKEFPALYKLIQPENLIRARVNRLHSALRSSRMAAEVFNSVHHRYPSTAAELTGDVEYAGDFVWSIDGGGGRSFPTIRAVLREDNRIAGGVSLEKFLIPEDVRRLQKDAACHVSKYFRNFLKNADAKTGERFMQVSGVPAGMSREELLAKMDVGVKHDCN